MNAKYFHDRLLSGCYNNCAISIHHKGDDATWYTMYSSGNGFKYTLDGTQEVFRLQDLNGDDFERFNIVQILRSGYIVLNTDTEIAVKSTISAIYGYINFLDEDSVEGAPYLCGGSSWIQGFCERFQYYSVNDIEVSLQMIPNLCHTNVLRKCRDLKSLPFIKTMDSRNSIYVNFVEDMRENDYNKAYAKCEKALQDLLCYMKINGIDFKWVEIEMRKPAYY